MSPAFFGFCLENGTGVAPLKLDAVLRLKNDFGVQTVMLVRNPLFTEKVEPPPLWLNAAEAPSMTEVMSDPANYDLVSWYDDTESKSSPTVEMGDSIVI